MLFSLHLHALPEGADIRSGSVSILQVPNVLHVTQSSEKAIVHWDRFQIQAQEKVHFSQRSADSAILNRVVGDLPSTIDGLLTADGKVFLINPRGVVVGCDGVIQTNGFIASALQISDSEFLQNASFSFSGDSEESIVNAGSITALEGDVFLIAKKIVQNGRIEAKEGTVCLAGASEVLLVPRENQKCFIKPQANGQVIQTGSIESVQAEIRAAGGSVYALAINHTGIIEATGSFEQKGKILLQAERGCIQASGSLIAQNVARKGGEVHLFGEQISLIETCDIDVSDLSGGGEILIGVNPLAPRCDSPVATTVTTGPNTRIRANAIDRGDGGKILIWGAEGAGFYGSAEAKGGANFGNGGFVEISSVRGLDYRGNVNTMALSGKTGVFLLDPSDITISTSASSPAFTPPTYNPPGAAATLNTTDLQNALAFNNVVVTTAGGSGGSGNITWSASAPVTWSAANTLTLTANRALSLGSNITNTATGTFTAMNFTANSGGATTGTFIGIAVGAGVTISSTEGAIVMNGTGGNTGDSNVGVQLAAGSIVRSTGTGAGAATISITGTGGGSSGGGTNYGVQVTGASASITSVDGAIQIIGSSNAGSGTGNTNNHGIFVSAAGSISSTGSSIGASITLQGTGAAAQSSNTGVTITGTSSLVTSVKGAIQVTGTGGGSVAGSNFGVQLSSAGKITSTGTGANAAPITVTGSGGNVGGGTNTGLLITGANSAISTADGSITLTGTGGAGTSDGIMVTSSGSITYAGNTAGTISLTGTGKGGDGEWDPDCRIRIDCVLLFFQIDYNDGDVRRRDHHYDDGKCRRG